MPHSRILFLAIITLAVIAVVAISVIRPSLEQASITRTTQAAVANITTIRIDYGTEKEAWFRDVVGRFVQENPNIKVELEGMGSMEMFQAVSQLRDDSTTFARNKAIPTLWSPASTIQVNLADAVTQNTVGRSLGLNCKRLVISPNVILIWEDRARIFEQYYKDKGGITLTNIADALDPNGTVKGNWAALGAQQSGA